MCLRMQFTLLMKVTFFTSLYGSVQPHMQRFVRATWGTFRLTIEWLQLVSSIHEVRRSETMSSKTHICWQWNGWTYQSYCVSDWWIWESTHQTRTVQGCQWKSTRCWHRRKASSQRRRHLDCFHSSPSCIRGEWVLSYGSPLPNPTDLPPAPDKLMRIVSCNCKAGCIRGCGCRRADMPCSPVM